MWLCQVSNEVLWCKVQSVFDHFNQDVATVGALNLLMCKAQHMLAQLALNVVETIVIITRSYTEFRQRKQAGTPEMCEYKTGEKPAARSSSDRPTELIGCLACTHPSMRAVRRGQIHSAEPHLVSKETSTGDTSSCSSATIPSNLPLLLLFCALMHLHQFLSYLCF